MDSITPLEARVRTLERSLRHARLLTLMLGLGIALIAGAAMVPQEQDELTTGRLVLTNGPDSSAVVLLAGPESSLVIQTPTGEEVLRIGGPAARRIRR